MDQEAVLRGNAPAKIDDKGRLKVPNGFRARIQEAYGLMRRLIDALRVVRGNAKDLAIPAADSREFAYLARRMYYESPPDLARAIEVRMAFGRSLWDTFEELRASQLAQARR